MERQLLSFCITTVLCVILLLFRFSYSGDDVHNYLLINLALAWIPYLISLILFLSVHQKKAKMVFLVTGSLLWLLFFPNAPYIITDFIHLVPRSPVPFWYDFMLLSAFSFNGLMMGVASLRIMTSLVEYKSNRHVARGFLIAVIIVSSIGIYAGRMLRWNSWDVFVHPVGVIHYSLQQLTHPLDHARAIVYILSFSLFLLVSYRSLSSVLPVERK